MTISSFFFFGHDFFEFLVLDFLFFFFPSVFQGHFFLLYHFFLAVTTPGSLGVQQSLHER